MTSCATINTFDADGGAGFDPEIRKARKPHRCQECGCEIKPGERYERASGVYDGSFYHDISCLDCVSIREAFFQSWWVGELWSGLREGIEGGLDVSIAQLDKLTPVARRKVIEIIDGGGSCSNT